MTTSAPTSPTAPVLEFIGGDTEPSDEFVDALVSILWDAADRQLAGQDGDESTEGRRTA